MKIAVIVVIIGLIGAFVFFAISPKMREIDSTPVPTEIPQEAEFKSFTASFEIYTNGTKRIFTDSMYHNLSEDTYISATNSEVVNVNKKGVTWGDFFATLPFSLSKDCLVTGTGQTFCSNESYSLKFYLDDIERPNALSEEIISNSHLSIEYGLVNQ